MVPLAWYLLEGLLAADEDWAGAEAPYQAVIDTGHPHWAPVAQADLALLRQRRGDTGGARHLYEAAAASGDPQVVPLAQANLGGLLLAGEPERARELLEAALASGNPQVVPLAQAKLGGLLMNSGEPERARKLLEAAAASGNPQVVPLAQAKLGGLLMNSGEPERARYLYEAAAASGNPQVVPLAWYLLGGLLAADEDWAGALRRRGDGRSLTSIRNNGASWRTRRLDRADGETRLIIMAYRWRAGASLQLTGPGRLLAPHRLGRQVLQMEQVAVI